MSISEETVKRVAHLAAIGDEGDMSHLCHDLNQILALVEQIQGVDTTGITPMSHAIEGQVQRLRPDVVTEPNLRAQVQALAPSTEASCYLVPKVIEGEDS